MQGQGRLSREVRDPVLQIACSVADLLRFVVFTVETFSPLSLLPRCGECDVPIHRDYLCLLSAPSVVKPL